MPVNVPYSNEGPTFGGVSQDLYEGTSIDQIDALVDLLMNYFQYTNSQVDISELVNAAANPAESATEAVPASEEAESQETEAAAAAGGPPLPAVAAGSTAPE